MSDESRGRMPAAPQRPATGEQYEISRGGARAVITELAAGLRLFERDGVALTESYGDAETPPYASGILLAPWPNRVAGGRWELDGRTQQLDITEPSRGNASHGLLRNTGYSLVERTGSSVTLAAGIFPQHGYPFHLTHTATYSIGPDLGLHVRQSLQNHSAAAAPVALGAHPFLKIGGVDTRQLTLTVSGSTRLVANEQLIPVRSEAVSGPWDLRTGTPVGDRTLDAAYTDLEFDGGRSVQRLSAPDGRHVELWADEAFPYVHVFVTDRYPGLERAVALEPMSAPANALNSGEGLRWLASGERFSGTWGINSRLR